MTSSSKKAQGYDGPIRVLACKWVRSIDVSKDSSAMKVIDKKKHSWVRKIRFHQECSLCCNSAYFNFPLDPKLLHEDLFVFIVYILWYRG